MDMLRRAPVPDDTTLEERVKTFMFETLFGSIYDGTGEFDEQVEMHIATVREM
jgi:hypothetical protein